MNYATIKNCDIANGPGVRVSLFVSGCTHHCPGCFNEVAWDFGYGEPFTQQTIDLILDMLRPDYIRGLTLLGGEPFEPQNQGAIVELLRQIKREMPRKSIWAFSGYLFEKDILSGRLGDTREYLSYLDVLVDGPFVEAKKNLSLRFRGSENQRLIAVSIDGEQSSPSVKQAKRLRELDQEGLLNGDVIDGILSEEKREVDNVIISTDELNKYFGKEVTPAKMKEQIMALLDEWKEKQPPELGKPDKKKNMEK